MPLATKNSKTPSDDWDSRSSTSLQAAAVSLSEKSNNPSVELNPGKDESATDRIAASDAWDSTTSTLIAAASQTKANAGTLSTDDWCEKTNSQENKLQRIAERSRSRLSSNHSIKEKDRNNSSSSRSSREKVSSRSSKSSRRHSDSSSKRSDHHRSDRDKKKDTKERDHHRSSKRRDEHHYNSDRDKKREKERKKDIPEQAKSSSIKIVVVDEELYDPSQPLNSDDDVPIPGSFNL